MRWQGRRQSGNIEDRRGAGGMSGGFGGGPRISFGGGRGGGGLGLGFIAVILVVGWLAGVNPLELLSQMDGGGPLSQSSGESAQPGQVGTPADEGGQFVATILADTEDTWTAIFSAAGRRYEPPTLVLFSGTDAIGLRVRHRRHRSVLLSGRPQGLHRPRVLRRTEVAVPRAGRFRAGLRRSARDRASRAEPPRHPAQDRRDAPAVGRGGCQQADRAAGVAGGLFRGRVGARGREARRPRSRRHRRGAERRLADRRRHAAEAQPRLCRAGFIHPRHVRATFAAGSSAATTKARSTLAIPTPRRRSEVAPRWRGA